MFNLELKGGGWVGLGWEAIILESGSKYVSVGRFIVMIARSIMVDISKTFLPH